MPLYWVYRNGKYTWTAGHWERERRGQQWVPPKWVEKKVWVLEAGHWERGGRNDRDGDGVRNRNDAAPNNPNRR